MPQAGRVTSLAAPLKWTEPLRYLLQTLPDFVYNLGRTLRKGGGEMEGYLSLREAAERWGVSERRISQYCTQGRIPGAQKFGRSWAVPADAEKPEDPRRTGKQAPPSQAELPP